MPFRDQPMDCPQCGKQLSQYDDRDKWRCKTCNGVLVGFEQLEVELGELGDLVLDDDPDGSRVAARPCPMCAFAMSPYTMGGVELDRCQNDAIVWFDGGEIGRLRTLIAEANPEQPFITRIVETVLEVQAEDEAAASGAFDDIPPVEPADVAPVSAEEWQERRLCPDGACTGVLGADGACKVCGKTPAA